MSHSSASVEGHSPTLRLPKVYGARARVGVIVPTTNTANEVEWNAMAPPGVSIHAARMALHLDTGSRQGMESLLADLARAAGDLAAADVDVIVYGCTAGSMVEPIDELATFIQEKTGVAGLTTIQAIVQALRALRIRRVAIATPYHAELNDHEKTFLENCNIEVLAIQGLGYGANGPQEFRSIARVPGHWVVNLVKEVNSQDAEAILISCTDLATLDLIQDLEAELEKPVISSNSATFWAALRTAGIDDVLSGYGQLFQCCAETHPHTAGDSPA